MANEVRVPKLGETMTETELIEWVAKEGDKIEVRQVMVVLQTEKTSYELEAVKSGILHIITPINKTIPVNHIIAMLAETPEEYEEIKNISEPD
ncbi:MAG: hypothetical protein PHQ86_05275 [Dehalococcoidales bacterium]|nr:hypothetical protein [Dehalococcoidales bacterium]